ncbi:MAG: putative S-layer protein [Eubacterium sp.]|nr:putative S-layer protein [Eubacterium sp.]
MKLDRKAVLEAVNNSEDSVRTIRLPVEGELDSLDFQLDADIIKFLGEKEITLEVETGIGSYILPASKIIPENMKKQLENTNLKEVMVSIKIAKAEEKYANTLKKNQANKKFQIVTQPVEFSIVCSIGGKDLEVKSFDSIVKKLLPVSENVDGRKVTTAVVIEPNGAIRHVPTKVVIREGKYFAEVSSLTNSVYSLVYNSRSYADTKKHWAEEAINDLASRMVVNGVAKNLFNPNRDITRAEFAAIIVTALGLKPGAGTDSFSDVKAADWYAGYIETATEYKLISGYGNGRFGPKDKITREQAMSIIGKAMSITGLKMELTSQESNELLAGFSDGSKAADYSKNSIAACVNSGIVSGRKGNFIAPKENITRAEVVIMVRNLLKESGLI